VKTGSKENPTTIKDIIPLIQHLDPEQQKEALQFASGHRYFKEKSQKGLFNDEEIRDKKIRGLLGGYIGNRIPQSKRGELDQYLQGNPSLKGIMSRTYHLDPQDLSEISRIIYGERNKVKHSTNRYTDEQIGKITRGLMGTERISDIRDWRKKPTEDNLHRMFGHLREGEIRRIIS
jgi:hypothetical protein